MKFSKVFENISSTLSYKFSLNKDPIKKLKENEAQFHISEIFASFQFENNIVSFCKPCIFLRFCTCNLFCKGCDTAYALNAESGSKLSYKEVSIQIENLCKKYNIDLITISGGESLLHQKQIECLIQKFKHLEFDIETNGTLLPTDFLLKHVHFWNISPKLSNMAENALNLQVISFFNKVENCIYKFVIDSPEDFNELESLIKKANIPSNKIILMPKGKDAHSLTEKSLWLIDYCKIKGYRFSPRLHIMLYGNQRGV